MNEQQSSEKVNEEALVANARGDKEVPEEPAKEARKIFRCYMCDLYAAYNYFGTRPLERHPARISTGGNQQQQQPPKEDVVLLEKCYVCDDPFDELRAFNYLVLGATCHVCERMVCVDNECSLFYYDKRFCLNCARPYAMLDKSSANDDNIEFPHEIVNELRRIMQKKNSSSSS